MLPKKSAAEFLQVYQKITEKWPNFCEVYFYRNAYIRQISLNFPKVSWSNYFVLREKSKKTRTTHDELHKKESIRKHFIARNFAWEWLGLQPATYCTVYCTVQYLLGVQKVFCFYCKILLPYLDVIMPDWSVFVNGRKCGME
jgi:hypothetical protein